MLEILISKRRTKTNLNMWLSFDSGMPENRDFPSIYESHDSDIPSSTWKNDLGKFKKFKKNMPQKKSTTEGEKKVLTKTGNFNCKCKLFEHQAKLLIKKKFSPPSPLSLESF